MDPRRREVLSEVRVTRSWSMGDRLDGELLLLLLFLFLKLTLDLLVERKDDVSSLLTPLNSAVLPCTICCCFDRSGCFTNNELLKQC